MRARTDVLSVGLWAGHHRLPVAMRASAAESCCREGGDERLLGRVLVEAELVVRVVVVALVRIVVDTMVLDQQHDFAEDEVEDPLVRVDFTVQVAGGQGAVRKLVVAGREVSGGRVRG